MFRLISRIILKIFGWKRVGEFPKGDRFVVLAAPHTSLWDFVWGRLYYSSIGKPVMFMIKDKYFAFPLGILLRWLGAIPVYIGKKTGLVQQMVDEFAKRDQFLITIAPEATRKRVNRWKKGFYHISREANVPIALGYIDYKKRTLGIMETISPSGDEKADFEKMRIVYSKISAKHPEKFNTDTIYAK